MRPEPGRRIVQGLEPFTFDTDTSGALVLRVVGSPHAHARIASIDTTAARAVPGVVAVFTHQNVTARRLLHRAARAPRGRSRRHRASSMTSCASSGSAWPPSSPRRPRPPTRRCRLIAVEYDVLQAVFDPEEARRPGAPLVHPGLTAEDRVAEASRNVLATLHDGIGGDVDAALAASAVTVTGTWQTQPCVACAARDARLGRLPRRRGAARHPLEHAGAVPHARRARAAVRAAPRAGPRASRRGWAAASAASRRCSPKTSWPWPCCAPDARWPTSSRAPTSSAARRCGIRSVSA